MKDSYTVDFPGDPDSVITLALSVCKTSWAASASRKGETRGIYKFYADENPSAALSELLDYYGLMGGCEHSRVIKAFGEQGLKLGYQLPAHYDW